MKLTKFLPCETSHPLRSDLDQENGTTHWEDAIKKELYELKLYNSFQVFNQGEPPPPGYKSIPMHMVFDVKQDGRRKARYVMNGNLTGELSPNFTYALL